MDIRLRCKKKSCFQRKLYLNILKTKPTDLRNKTDKTYIVQTEYSGANKYLLL